MGYLKRVFAATERENRRAILRLLPPGRGGALLDLGTSTGEFTLAVAARLGATRVAGVELMPEHAAAARGRGIDVACADLDEGLPFPDAAFATVHANQVIEHVRRTDTFLGEVRRVLAPGGVACLSTNNLASWHTVGSLVLGFQPMPAHVSDEVIVGNPLDPLRGHAHQDLGRTHLRLFTARALTELCAHHGLERMTLRTVGYYPLPPVLGRAATRIDSRHGAFLTGLFRRPGTSAQWL
jgi:SAM-dependent methyltransferase